LPCKALQVGPGLIAEVADRGASGEADRRKIALFVLVLAIFNEVPLLTFLVEVDETSGLRFVGDDRDRLLCLVSHQIECGVIGASEASDRVCINVSNQEDAFLVNCLGSRTKSIREAILTSIVLLAHFLPDTIEFALAFSTLSEYDNKAPATSNVDDLQILLCKPLKVIWLVAGISIFEGFTRIGHHHRHAFIVLPKVEFALVIDSRDG